MVCYVVPIAATLISIALNRLGVKFHKSELLTTMFTGGAMFGLIDHAWNGELFMFGPNLMMDMSLGITITAGLFGTWGVISFKQEIGEVLKNAFQHVGFLR